MNTTLCKVCAKRPQQPGLGLFCASCAPIIEQWASEYLAQWESQHNPVAMNYLADDGRVRQLTTHPSQAAYAARRHSLCKLHEECYDAKGQFNKATAAYILAAEWQQLQSEVKA